MKLTAKKNRSERIVVDTCFLHMIVCHEHCLDLSKLYTEPIDLNLFIHSPLENIFPFSALDVRRRQSDRRGEKGTLRVT